MTNKPFCVEENEKIENYDLAAKDNFKGWDLHHRLGTHTADGNKRDVFISKKELIAMNLYYYRPAKELIYLKHSDHIRLHHLDVRSKNAKTPYYLANREKLCEYQRNYDKEHKEEKKSICADI